MKIKDIIYDDKDYKMVNITNHLRRKKKANPKASKTGRLSNFIDVFGGLGGYKSDPTDSSSDVVQ